MHTELLVVLAAVVLGIVHLALQGQSKKGPWGLAGHTGAPGDHLAARLDRANANFKETFPLFVAVVLVGAVSQRLSSSTSTAAVVWLVARLAYLPLYAFGPPLLRSTVWVVSIAAIFVAGIAVAVG